MHLPSSRRDIRARPSAFLHTFTIYTTTSKTQSEIKWRYIDDLAFKWMWPKCFDRTDRRYQSDFFKSSYYLYGGLLSIFCALHSFYRLYVHYCTHSQRHSFTIYKAEWGSDVDEMSLNPQMKAWGSRYGLVISVGIGWRRPEREAALQTTSHPLPNKP